MDRIAIIHNHPIHYKHLLFSAMKKRGLLFRVLYLASGSEIRYERLPLSQESYEYEIGYEGPYEEAPAWRRGWFVWRECQKIKPPILIISGYYAIECWIGLLWAKLNDVPVLLWFESNEFDYVRYWPKEMLKRIFVRRCRAAHVYGSTNRDYLVKLGMPESDVVLKRAVVDVKHFFREGDRQYAAGGIRRFLFVGRLAPEKNLPMLVSAFAALVAETGRNASRLTLVGTGPCEEELREQCAALGIEDLVEFAGYCEQKNLGAVLDRQDILILCSKREAFGLTVLEGMLRRMPIIVSRKCGCAKDLVKETTGWTFDPGSVQELVEAMRQAICASLETLASMGKAAQALAVMYSPDACAERVMTSIAGLVNGSRDATIDGEPNHWEQQG